MIYTLRGQLRAWLCEDCLENLSGLKVQLYRVQDNIDVAQMVAANPKATAKILNEKEVEARKGLLIAETTTDQEGQYQFEIDGDQVDYNGEAVEVVVVCDSVPNLKREKKNQDTVYFSITIFQPMWRETGNGLFSVWNYTLSARFWCAVRALFDAWVICGRIIHCETQRPIPNVRVLAFDSDWISDDDLGQDITDSNGHFRIDYTSRDFKNTFLSPIINLETPFSSVSGPDVYFRVETNSDEPFVFLEEPKSRGYEPDRENRGNCFCVEICIDTEIDIPGESTVEPALFTHVGGYDIYTQIDSNGLTNDSQRNAFTEVIPLIGVLPGGIASNEMEYRFRIMDLNTTTELTATEVNNLITATIIGSITRRFPHDPGVIDSIPGTGYYRTYPYGLKNTGAVPKPPDAAIYNVDPDVNGWVRVPRENDLDGLGVFQASHPSMALARINTRLLFDSAFDLINPTTHIAGNKMNASDRFSGPMPAYQIMFEAREVGTTTVTYSNILARLAVWNGEFAQRRHPNWSGGNVTLKGVAMLDIQELQSDGCGGISNTVTALYTAYHPYLESLEVKVKGPSGIFGVINPGLDADNEASGNNVYNLTGMPNCAYILKLRADYRLTSGFGRRSDAHNTDEIAFCKK
ncbi:MAG: hypothetical protein AAFX87_30850 [Bacteroidota bacterium]